MTMQAEWQHRLQGFCRSTPTLHNTHTQRQAHTQAESGWRLSTNAGRERGKDAIGPLRWQVDFGPATQIDPFGWAQPR